MIRIAPLVSWLSLLGSLLASLLFFVDQIPLDQAKSVLLILAVLWFLVTPVWMERSAGRTGGRERSDS